MLIALPVLLSRKQLRVVYWNLNSRTCDFIFTGFLSEQSKLFTHFLLLHETKQSFRAIVRGPKWLREPIHKPPPPCQTPPANHQSIRSSTFSVSSHSPSSVRRVSVSSSPFLHSPLSDDSLRADSPHLLPRHLRIRLRRDCGASRYRVDPGSSHRDDTARRVHVGSGQRAVHHRRSFVGIHVRDGWGGDHNVGSGVG